MARTVSQEIALMKRLRADIDALNLQMRPFQLQLNKLFRALEQAEYRAACKKVSGCRGYRNLSGCHVV